MRRLAAPPRPAGSTITTKPKTRPNPATNYCCLILLVPTGAAGAFDWTKTFSLSLISKITPTKTWCSWSSTSRGLVVLGGNGQKLWQFEGYLPGAELIAQLEKLHKG